MFVDRDDDEIVGVGALLAEVAAKVKSRRTDNKRSKRYRQALSRGKVGSRPKRG